MVAQLVEQWTENPRVGGSIPSHATIRPKAEWLAWEVIGRAPEPPARLSPLNSLLAILRAEGRMVGLGGYREGTRASGSA